ncbi:MAG: sulfatase, partial [Planctomycetota bacterium]
MNERLPTDWRALCAAVLLAACGTSGDAPPPPPPLLPFGDLEAAYYEWSADQAPAPEQRLELAPWQLMTSGAEPLIGVEEAAQAGFGAGLGDDGVVLRGPLAAAYTVIEVPPGTRSVDLRARVSIRNYTLDPEDNAARLMLIELPEMPRSETGKQIVENSIEFHDQQLIFGSDPRERPQWMQIDLDAATRAVAVGCSHRSAGGEGEAYFDAVEVRVAGPLTRALRKAAGNDVAYGEPARVDGDGRQRPRRAEFSVDLVHRYGIPLLPGSTAVLPLETDAERTALECFVTVVGESARRTWRFELEWQASGAPGTPVGSARVPLRPERTGRVAPAGWVRLTGSLPPGATGALRMRATPEGKPGRGVVPVIAGLTLTDPARDRAGDPRPNVLLVSLDTLRADRLVPRLMPRLSELAERSHRFDNCWSTSSWTLPSHMSLFTGQVPTVHGVQRSSLVRDPARSPSLVEDVAAAGYRTAAFTAGGMVLPRFGYMSGFERYSTLDPGANYESDRIRTMFRATAGGDDPRVRAASDVAAIEDWVVRAAGDPWFLFVHTYAAHEFEPPARCLEALDLPLEPTGAEFELREYLSNGKLPPPESLRRLRELYDASALQADELVGHLVDLLERTGQLESTVIVVTSDHGKEFAEHGVVAHANALHEELLHVPLVVHLPGQRRGRRSDAPVSWIDLSPTLRSLVGIAVPETLTGLDLFEDRLPAGRPIWGEMDTALVSQAVRVAGTKVVRESEPGEPFEWRALDLDSDPGEQHPAPPTDPQRSLLLDHYQRLLGERDALPATLTAPAPLELRPRGVVEG